MTDIQNIPQEPSKAETIVRPDPQVLNILKSFSSAYYAVNSLTPSDTDYQEPAAIIDAALKAAFDPPQNWTLRAKCQFWSHAGAADDLSGFAYAAAASFWLEHGYPERAYQQASQALYSLQNNLHVQSILQAAGGQKPTQPDLSERFCAAPFENLETTPEGNVHFCCPAWLPKPIGNIHRDTPAAIWDSPAAQDIRRSIHDGSFRFCSRIHCPKISGNTLPNRTELTHKTHHNIAKNKRITQVGEPKKIILSHDKSCNLSCPSCRTQLILAKKPEQKQLNRLADKVIFPLLSKAERVRVTASGDPFGSAHFQYVLRNIDRSGNPDLRVDIQTNGVLLTPSLWERLRLEGKIDQLMVSVDATDADTYAIVRRGGNFDVLMKNLGFLAKLRSENRIGRLRLDFVVQSLNFAQMPDFVDLADRFGCDGAKFQMIRSWGTYSAEEFKQHNIADPAHTQYSEFLRVLAEPRLHRKTTELWGMAAAIAQSARLCPGHPETR